MADSLTGTGVSMQILRPGPVRTKMTAHMPDQPFTSDVDQVAEATMKGLASSQRIITVPGVLRYIFSVLRHLPAPLWRKVSAR
jgi:short-subunit dehydrogenase